MKRNAAADEFMIGEVEAITGVPRRTIHFYVQQGVLPAPVGAGLAARYEMRHLLRLRAIPHLRALGWRLDRIRSFFQQATDDAIAAVAEGRGEPAEAITADRSPATDHPPLPTPAEPVLLARYALAPGVDLVVERDLPPDLRRRVGRLLDAASAIFATDVPSPVPTSRSTKRRRPDGGPDRSSESATAPQPDGNESM